MTPKFWLSLEKSLSLDRGRARAFRKLSPDRGRSRAPSRLLIDRGRARANKQQMTRRAFSALKIIRLKGKLRQEWQWIFRRFWSNIVIAQNPWIRLAQDQFFIVFRPRPIQECIRCVCLCALAKYLMMERIFGDTKISRFSWIFEFSRKLSGSF